MQGKNSGISSIDDLENKIFAFVSMQSSSGYTYPLARFIDLGIDYHTYFNKVYFLGSHPRVTDAIVAGSVDAGATWDYNLKKAIEKHGDIFNIIATVGTIPNLGIASNSLLSDDVKKKIKSALINIDPMLLKGLPASGYVAGDDAYYDKVREVIDQISDVDTASIYS
ncbi:MAG: PhnD/SsuA/transferrin family substrate-binding protein [Gammaproteobacteria bacterium]|nr:PhnD/SsuA/transferrin family substrate-binding protein [Gammaproteobacteria bacterium]